MVWVWYILGPVLAVLAWRMYWWWWWPAQLAACMRSQGIPGPKYRPLLGQTSEIQASTKENEGADSSSAFPIYKKWQEDYGDVYFYFSGPLPRLVISDPILIRDVLGKNHKCFAKSRGIRRKLCFLGKGLFTSHGERWERQRGLLQPLFSHKHLKEMHAAMVETTREAIGQWEARVQEGPIEVDVAADLAHVTLSVIGRTLFPGSGVGERRDLARRIIDGFRKVLASTTDTRVNWLGALPGYTLLPLLSNLTLHWEKYKLRRLVSDIIQQRRGEESGSGDMDLISCLLAAQDDGSPRLTHKEAVDNCLTFLFAGHETTTELLSWTMMLLAKHPEWADRARAEVETLCGREPLTWQNVPRLRIVSNVLSEALRLYPPMAIVERECIAENRVGPYLIPRGIDVVMPLYRMHVDPKLWGSDAHQFRPDRFDGGVSSAAKHPLALLPFGTGPRTCIGQPFALIEAKTILVAMLQSFEWHLSPSYNHSPLLHFTLSPEHGVPLYLQRRVAPPTDETNEG